MGGSSVSNLSMAKGSTIGFSAPGVGKLVSGVLFILQKALFV